MWRKVRYIRTHFNFSLQIKIDSATNWYSFGGKSAKLRLKFKEPPMLGNTIFKNVTVKLNGLYIWRKYKFTFRQSVYVWWDFIDFHGLFNKVLWPLNFKAVFFTISRLKYWKNSLKDHILHFKRHRHVNLFHSYVHFYDVYCKNMLCR